MQWLKSVTMHLRPHAPPERQAASFTRREAELRERHERLERLAIEADVIQRADTSEELREQ